MAKKGRPSREPTPEERQKVKDMSALKATVAHIAKVLKRSEPNLRKYFSEELFSEKKSKRVKKSPPPKITKALRKKVVIFAGINMSAQEIAYALDTDLAFIEQSFAKEIEIGRAKLRGMVGVNLVKQMEQGTIGATNRLESITAVPVDTGGEPKARGAAENYVGKKVTERAGAHAAAAAGGKFAPMAPPRLVIDNDGGR